MKITSALRFLALAPALMALPPASAPAQETPPIIAPAPDQDRDAAVSKVQLALLLDTGGSMQGLINQARRCAGGWRRSLGGTLEIDREWIHGAGFLLKLPA